MCKAPAAEASATIKSDFDSMKRARPLREDSHHARPLSQGGRGPRS